MWAFPVAIDEVDKVTDKALMRRLVNRSGVTDTIFSRSLYVQLLSALVMDPLLTRCMLGSDMGCCYLASELCIEPSVDSGSSFVTQSPKTTSTNG